MKQKQPETRTIGLFQSCFKHNNFAQKTNHGRSGPQRDPKAAAQKKQELRTLNELIGTRTSSPIYAVLRG